MKQTFKKQRKLREIEDRILVNENEQKGVNEKMGMPERWRWNLFGLLLDSNHNTSKLA